MEKEELITLSFTKEQWKLLTEAISNKMIEDIDASIDLEDTIRRQVVELSSKELEELKNQLKELNTLANQEFEIEKILRKELSNDDKTMGEYIEEWH